MEHLFADPDVGFVDQGAVVIAVAVPIDVKPEIKRKLEVFPSAPAYILARPYISTVISEFMFLSHLELKIEH